MVLEPLGEERAVELAAHDRAEAERERACAPRASARPRAARVAPAAGSSARAGARAPRETR